MATKMLSIGCTLTLAFVCSCGSDASRSKPPSTASSMGIGHETSLTGATVKAPIMITPERLKWVDAPPMLPPGAKIAVLDGDPSTPNAIFTVRATMPPGYRIMPHTHPTDEHVTVISGTMNVGHGDTFAKEHMTALPPGGFAVMPAGHRHFAMAGATETVIQIHAIGPLEFTYLNPADDPRNQKSARQ